MYLPHKTMDKEIYPNREWFWSVVATVIPDWATKYREVVTDQRREKKTKLP